MRKFLLPILGALILASGLASAATYAPVVVIGGKLNQLSPSDTLSPSAMPLDSASGTLAAAHGGTGLTTIGANCVVIGAGTSAVHTACPVANGDVLTDNGVGHDPTFQSSLAGGIGAIAANSALVNNTGSTAAPTAVSLPQCNNSNSALAYDRVGGAFACNTITTSGTPGGVSGNIQFNNAGAFGGLGVTGSGNVVEATSPTLVTPALGTPSSGVATNLIGLPLTTGITGTLATSHGGTGATSYTNGQLLIGNTGTGGLSVATLTAGSGITITNGGGSITVAASATTTPSGAIIMYGANSAPSGWLICDGSAVSRTTYAALYAVVGTTFGVGDGSTTFNLPDMRGQFARGYDSAGTVDPSRTFGSKQLDQMQGHYHSPLNGSFSTTGFAGTSVYNGSNTPELVTSSTTGQATTDGTDGTPRVGKETRPTNVALSFIIKTHYRRPANDNRPRQIAA